MYNFCGNQTSYFTLRVTRAIRTPDESENTGPFILQRMMSLHKVDEIRRCLGRVQQKSDEASPAGFSHF